MPDICEARIEMTNPEAACEAAIADLRPCCRNVAFADGSYHLNCDTAKATVRIANSALLVRVEADDPLYCNAAKALILTKLQETASEMPPDVLWINGTDIAFAALTTSS